MCLEINQHLNIKYLDPVKRAVTTFIREKKGQTVQIRLINEPRREKIGFLHMRKTQISFAVTAKLISAFVFATRILQSLYFLNTKVQASSHLLWLYSLVYVDLVENPEDRFSHNEAQIIVINDLKQMTSLVP